MDKERAAKAAIHTEKMAQMFSDRIKNSVDNSVIYLEDSSFEKKKTFAKTKVTVVDASTAEAILMFREEELNRMCALNFASFVTPGGEYIKGGTGQEEDLCSHSTLYNVLSSSEFDAYYRQNRLMESESMYSEKGVYTPDIVFDNKFLCDVISVSAPNIAVAKHHWGVYTMMNASVLEKRIKYVLSCAADRGVVTLILGAFGCGSFGQDPKLVAELFKKALITDFRHSFDHVIFAVPDENSVNYKTFLKTFGGDNHHD